MGTTTTIKFADDDDCDENDDNVLIIVGGGGPMEVNVHGNNAESTMVQKHQNAAGKKRQGSLKIERNYKAEADDLSEVFE